MSHPHAPLSRRRRPRRALLSYGRLLWAATAAAAVALLLTGPAAAEPSAPPAASASPGLQRTPAAARYEVVLSGNDTGDRWRGTQRVHFTNTAGTALDRVWLRLWGNGIHGCTDTLPLRVSSVAGGTAGPLAVDCTALPVDLPEPLAPGAETAVSFDLAIDVPEQRQRFGRVGAFSYLGNAIPVLAVRDAGGWHLPPYVPKGGSFGESFFSLTADYTVTLDHPSTLTVPTTGGVVGTETAAGRTRTVVHAPLVRDFAFAAGPFREVTTVTQAGVAVHGWATPDVTAQRAEAVTDTVRSAVEVFSARYGAYPYAELDAVISGHFAESGGMEYPGIVWTEPVGSVAAHETAHQWWYGVSGNDQFRHPWLDESVTQFTTDEFLGRSRHCDPYAWPSATARVDAGMDYFATHDAEYVPTVYGQGPCMLHDLQHTLGVPAMRLALRAVLETNRHGVVTPAEFRRVMQHHSPVDLDPLWQRWRNVRG